MDLLDLLSRWGLALVFGSVLLEQSGFPLPAAPILVASGALTARDMMRPELVLLVALLSGLLADHVWFLMGRRYGRRLLAGICRLSLSPDTCVRKTDDLIGRHGATVLLVAKFIPGVSAMAIPTAAAMGLSYRRFILYDSLGCLIWCGAYIGLGMIFSREVNDVLAAMSVIGGWSLLVVAGLLALYIAYKLFRRSRLKRLFQVVRITPEQMLELLISEPELVVLDARSDLARSEDPRQLPRAIVIEHDDPMGRLPHDARERTIITFCTCPNEASAALLAERLIKAGYTRVRVLVGGADALTALASA
jgi:membrane protein DedA with SNARE-associated domain/rhodanese-related sulfurtransferase